MVQAVLWVSQYVWVLGLVPFVPQKIFLDVKYFFEPKVGWLVCLKTDKAKGVPVDLLYLCGAQVWEQK